jgi:gamma-glutamyltranspeptidase/glutathione hydrolase
MKHIEFFMILLVSLILCMGCTQSGSVRHAQGFSETFRDAAVAADHPLASDAGAQMLSMGGNAVDAAVAASFTLSVVRPYSCGIGGGGFMVINLPDDPTHGFVRTAINYRETSPYGADYYERTGESSTVGGSAVAVPGTVPGLVYALEHYGTLDLETVIAPAMDACIQGFVVDEHYASNAQDLIERFENDPELKERFPLVWNSYLRGGSIRVGDRIRNIGQLKAMNWIRSFGQDAFAEHRIGGALVRAVRESGGELTVEDLLAYSPVELSPVEQEIDGRTFLSMPPPSSGGVTMIQCLKILEQLEHRRGDADEELELHRLSEALKHAFADRARYLGDPAFVDVPTQDVLDEANIQRMSAMIDDRAHSTRSYGTHDALPIDGGTSHVSAVDQWGGAVAMTETINLIFGSLVGVDEYGFVLNNEMDDFTTVRGRANAFGLVQSDRNMPELGKRPLSSMSPTIVLDSDGRVLIVAGASGGPRIITGTLQAILNALSGMDAGAAVEAPRIHHQWIPDRLDFEDGFSDELRESLAARGHEIGRRRAVGNVQLIKRDPSGKGWQAASDPRKGGTPAGID